MRDVIKTATNLKWKCAGHIVRQGDGRPSTKLYNADHKCESEHDEDPKQGDRLT